MAHHRPEHFGLALALALWLPSVAGAELQFPALTGRVVDQANLLSPAVRQRLSERLAAHEKQTSNQLVVVTLRSLGGRPIEDYGYQLGRHWGIGQKGRDNGVLLIVAPVERAVRIEVGYGLEGSLTDAVSHDIIQSRILPAFKRGDFEGGITAGAEAVLAAIAGTYAPVEAPAGSDTDALAAVLVLIGVVIGELIYAKTRNRALSGMLASGGSGIAAILLATLGLAVSVAFLTFIAHQYLGGFSVGRLGGGGYGGYSNHRRRSRRAGGFTIGGGGFSGGGGSFGGGGASGSW